MNFGMIKTKQNYVTRILTALLSLLKLNIFTKKLQMMLKSGLTHLTMMKVIKDRFQWIKTYTYLMDDDSELKKGKGTKKCLIKRGLTFKNYKDCNFNNKTMLKSQQKFKSDHHKVCIH